MSVSISLSEPWTPSLQGNALPPYLELEALSRARPNISHHETWARTTVMAYTEQVPAAEGAIQESVLILWRLHRLFSAEQEPTWQQYTSAWLHRYRDLVWESGIEHIPAVLDFVDFLRINEFPESMLPAMIKPARPATPSRPQPTPKPRIAAPHPLKQVSPFDSAGQAIPTVRTGPPRGAKNKTTVYQDPSESGEDEVAPADAAPATTTRESKKRTQRPSTDRTDTTGTTKRSRTEEKPEPKEDPNKVDLTGHTWPEETKVLSAFVPLIANQTCGLCSAAGKPCEPLWFHKNKKNPQISCRGCINNGKGCTFADKDFGIVGWPTLVESQDGKARRSKATTTRRKNGRTPTPAIDLDARAVSEGSARAAPAEVIPFQGIHNPLSVGSAFDFGSRRGQGESFQLDDLIQFQAELGNPTPSSTSIQLAIAGLQATKLREAGMLASLQKRIEARVNVIDSLIARFELAYGTVLLEEGDEDAKRRVHLALLANKEKEMMGLTDTTTTRNDEGDEKLV